VPLELRNIPQNMAVVGNVAGSLEVRVQGQERVLRDVTIGKKVFGIADLSQTRVGENFVRISPDDIRRPSGVAITHMSLSEIKVNLEPLVRKTYRLKPVLRGVPAGGYRLMKIAVAPSRITVEGPASVVQTMESLQTLPIDVQDANESMNIVPKIDYQGKQVKILEKDVSVRIVIERTRK
jgi:hypothetical protein